MRASNTGYWWIPNNISIKVSIFIPNSMFDMLQNMKPVAVAPTNQWKNLHVPLTYLLYALLCYEQDKKLWGVIFES